MRIAITGASGLIGTAVTRRLENDGHTITRLVRSREAARAADALYWRPDRSDIDAVGLAGHEVVVNLAGENIFAFWTDDKKERIRRSRVDGTRLLARTMASLSGSDRPSLLINASAVGYFGDRPADEPLPEDASPGDTFMAGVVREWEAATSPASEAGIRVVMLRFSPVLDPEAFVLRSMALASRFGLGATLGSGDQPFPWVTRAEIANLVAFVIDRPDLEGPINVAAPDSVSNAEFVDTVARVVSRPRFLMIPSPLVRLLGGIGEEVLGGARVVPAKLEAAGYPWHDPALEPALRRMLD
jgi:uncharacterized protein